MAKLSARGRTELLRIQFPKTSTNSEYTTHEQITLAVMSDRRILRKHTVWWNDSSMGKSTSGWKQWRRFKPDVNLEAKVADMRERYTSRGCKVT